MKLEPDKFKMLKKTPFLTARWTRSMVKEKKKSQEASWGPISHFSVQDWVYVETCTLVNGI